VNTPGVDPNTARTGLARWSREPLVVFVLIGALLFAVNNWRNTAQGREDDVYQITLTEDDLAQMAVALRVEGIEQLSPEQLQHLLDARVREEVVYREALAMGLDQNDTIVKRRMVQKMDFLAEDLSALREPTRDELQQWLDSHPQDFVIPPRATFRHIYFSSHERGSAVRDAAAAALESARGLAVDAPAVDTLGDRFMFQDYYAERTPEQVAQDFGGDFSRALFQLQPGAWSEPIASGFGWHLVFVDTLVPARAPRFEEVEGEIRAQWMADQRARFKDAAYEVMRAKYDVILPESVQARVQ